MDEEQSRSVRDRAALVLGAVLTAGFLAYVDSFYALGDWLLFRYLAYALIAAAWLACCGAAGHFVLRRLIGLRLPRHEQLVQALAVGVFGFGLGWFVLGLLRCWTPVAALLYPLLYAAPGVAITWRNRRRLPRWLRAHWRRGPTPLGVAAAGLGLLALALVYVPLLHPDNVAFDARFYHQALAEHYVAQGGVTRFDDGWFPGANPQLASYLYGWAYALPWPTTFDRVELSLHLELGLFLFTLASIPVLVRRLMPGQRVRAPLSWLAMLAFPGLYLYDSALSGAADHVAAAFAVPLLLALLRALPALELRATALCAVLCAAVLSTKYTAYGLVLAPLAALGVRWLWLLVRGPSAARRALLFVPALSAALVLALWAPHWLKNLRWYGDPLYPFLHDFLDVRPWGPRAAERLATVFFDGHRAERSLGGVFDSLAAAFTFSFVPHDWWHLHRDVPVFGSLFTLSLPFAALLRPQPRRLWLLYAAVVVAVVHWFWSYHFERYLQVLLPWMAAATAAVALAAWRLGPGGRTGVVLLFGAQLAWGADVPFFPTHPLVKRSPYQVSVEHMASGFVRQPDRFRIFGEYTELGRALPRGARVLLHDQHLRLGLGTAVISDAAVRQVGIDYALAPSPRGVFQRLRELGATHLIWEPGKSQRFDTLAGEIAFHRFVQQHVASAQRHGRFALAPMPETIPPDRSGVERVLLLTCGDSYPPGLHDLRSLTVQPRRMGRPVEDYPKPEQELGSASLAELSALAVAVVVNPRCHRGAVPEGFSTAFEYGPDRVYLRDAR